MGDGVLFVIEGKVSVDEAEVGLEELEGIGEGGVGEEIDVEEAGVVAFALSEKEFGAGEFELGEEIFGEIFGIWKGGFGVGEIVFLEKNFALAEFGEGLGGGDFLENFEGIESLIGVIKGLFEGGAAEEGLRGVGEFGVLEGWGECVDGVLVLSEEDEGLGAPEPSGGEGEEGWLVEFGEGERGVAAVEDGLEDFFGNFFDFLGRFCLGEEGFEARGGDLPEMFLEGLVGVAPGGRIEDLGVRGGGAGEG